MKDGLRDENRPNKFPNITDTSDNLKVGVNVCTHGKEQRLELENQYSM